MEEQHNNDIERVEVKSRWFSIKLEQINTYTLIAMAMILATMVTIVYLLTQ